MVLQFRGYRPESFNISDILHYFWNDSKGFACLYSWMRQLNFQAWAVGQDLPLGRGGWLRHNPHSSGLFAKRLIQWHEVACVHKRKLLSSISNEGIGVAGNSPHECGRIAYHSAYRNSQRRILPISPNGFNGIFGCYFSHIIRSQMLECTLLEVRYFDHSACVFQGYKFE